MKGIWIYRHLLPPMDDSNMVTLGEGSTPLIRSSNIANTLGVEHLFFKLETANPTGSYKDRFAAAGISLLKQQNAKLCFATSSGNTGSALAAYCAAAGIQCFIILVDGTPQGKMLQMNVYGARTIVIDRFGTDRGVTESVMEGLKSLAAKHHSALMVSAYAYSPCGMSGVQTIAYEIEETLPAVPKHVFCPAGGGGLALAIVKGFEQLKEKTKMKNLPAVHCVQPSGNDTIASALRNGWNAATAASASTTKISGLQVPNIIDGDKTLAACRSTKGNGFIVDDQEIYEAQWQLAHHEGIYCEPAGAVSLAGLKRALENGEVNAKDHIVCLVTGHGFKDPASALNIGGAGEKCRLKDFGQLEFFLDTQV